jgi:signal transduction histidine kinase
VSTSALVRLVVDAARRSPGWLRRRPWVGDLAVVLVFGVFAWFGTVQSVQEGTGNARRPLDWLAWVLLAAATGSLAARRRWPAAVLLVTCAATAASVALGYPTGPIWATPLIALYSAAATGRRALALLAAAALAAVPVAWVLLDRDAGTPAEVGVSVLFVALALALGEVTRGRRDYLAEAERRAVEAERTREESARRRAGEERLRLARDLHDITAHTIAVIAIQAGVAEEALDRLEADPEPAREAVRAIRASSREAMAELKATVTMLREGAAPRGPLPGLDQLEELVDMARSAGVRVELAVSGVARPLPPAVDLTAYRIVQESLTNVLRHAGAASATVRVCYRPDAVEVQVDDDGWGSGRPPPGAAGAPTGATAAAPGARFTGHGLAVMAERAAAVGGQLVAGPGSARGFRVHARLPLREAPP